MNILHINKFHYLRGGAEAVYFKTAELLEAHGHNSVFFSMHNPENLPCETSEFFMPCVDLIAKHSIASQLKIAGRLLYSFEARKRISKLLDKYSVDIAHLHNIYHHISPSILYELKKKKIPVVMTLHDYKMACASYSMLLHGKPCEACCGGRYYNAIKNRCVKVSLHKSILSTLEMYLHHKIFDIYDNVDIFISPSRFLKDTLLRMGFKKEIIYLPNFIDIHKFRGFNAEAKNERVEKKKSIVYFGRLSLEKGLWTLLETAKRLSNKNKHINVEIKIIGDGPIREELQEKVKVEGINKVKLLGYMRGEALFQEVAKSMAAVLPSEWYENNPMSVIEAFAMGIPVIAARIGGIPELIKENETGLTFEPGNALDLSAKIEYLLNNPDKAAKIGRNARTFVEQELNPEKYYHGLMKIYKRAIGDKL